MHFVGISIEIKTEVAVNGMGTIDSLFKTFKVVCVLQAVNCGDFPSMSGRG